MTVSNTAFTVFSGIGLVISIIPLWWHLGSWNVGTSMYLIWTALACLIHFVGSIVWNGNAINWAPVWCDIGTFRRSLHARISHRLRLAIRIQIGVAVAWPACGLCIIRSVYNVTVTTTPVGVRFSSPWISNEGHQTPQRL